MIGLYLHIPFCERKCNYCDFPSFAGLSALQPDYIDALIKEMRNSTDAGETLSTLYVGGGTPSALAPELMTKLMTAVGEIFTIPAGTEVTIEVNPATLTRKKAELYRDLGFNRVSVGFQAGQDELLKTLGRLHSAADFDECIENLQRAGFENISADVMYGLPGQRLVDLGDTLHYLLSLPVIKHISAYSLIVEEGTVFAKRQAQGGLSLPSEDRERAMHWLLADNLTKAGFNHYEISNFAKPGYESRHNLSYWEMKPYRGYGLGAASFIDNERFTNTFDLADYLGDWQFHPPRSQHQFYNRDESLGEAIMLGMRKLAGVDLVALEAQYGLNAYSIYKEEIARLLKLKLITLTDTQGQTGPVMRLTRKGQDFANEVFRAFI